MRRLRSIFLLFLIFCLISSCVVSDASSKIPASFHSSDIVKNVPYRYNLRLNPDNTARMLRETREAKGQRIGVGDKAVIALRFDDWQNTFRAQVFPELKKRELPASMALISEFQNIHWGAQCTWSDIIHWNRGGLEIWSHGTDHRDYKDFNRLVENIVGSKKEIESHDIKVQGFILPGVTKYYNQRPYGLLVRPEDYSEIPGRLIQQTYALSEAYAWGSIRQLPSTRYHGANHLTISDGRVQYDEIIHSIDEVIQDKTGLELMIHCGNLGLPGNLSLEDFLKVLDYLQAKRSDGILEILTPSGLMFADHSEHRLRLLDLDLTLPYSAKPSFTPDRFQNDGSQLAASLRLSGDGTSQLKLEMDRLIRKKADGESYEALVQTAGSTGKLTLRIHDGRGNLLSKTTTSDLEDNGQKRLVFIIPPGCDKITLTITAESAQPMDLLWTKVQKI